MRLLTKIADKIAYPGIVMLLAACVWLGATGWNSATPAQKVCEQAKAQGAQACQTTDAQVVETDDGHIFLIVKDKVYELQ